MAVVVSEMSDKHEHFASDLSTTRVAFRTDLRCTPNENARQPHMVVEDPVAGMFYRLGKIEFAFASLLTPSRTIAEAYRELCEGFPEHRLSENDAADLCRWLISSELAHTESSKSSRRLRRSAAKAGLDRIKQRSNPMAIRLPLLHPDRFVKQLNRRVGWLFGMDATIVGIAMIAIAGCLALANWKPLIESSGYLFSGSSLLVLVGITIVLKVIHEFAHAVVCKRHGGDVGEMGILFVLFAPLAYVDVSSVWRFRSRLRRIHVAAAGVYVELVIASLAMFVWRFVDVPFVRHVCTSTMLSASAATLLFNANPLMKFDGYFVLTDWTRSPNLYTDSQKYLLRFARRMFLGGECKHPNWEPGYRIAIACYGWLAMIWKGLVCIGLTIAATKLFHGLGTVLAIAACVAWVGVPAWRVINHVRKAPRSQRHRFAWTMTGCLVITALILEFIPWPASAAVPAVVEYSPHDVIRAKVAGFIDSIHVTSGQTVAMGDKLLTLRNHDLELADQQLRAKIEQSRIRQRQQTLKGQQAAAQAESAELDALTKQHHELLQQIESLTIRASRQGVVLGRRLPERIESYLKEGDEILVIGNESEKELRVLIAQDQYDQFRDQVGTSVRFRVGSSTPEVSTLAKIIPRANTHVEYPALLASNGGPLPVKAAPDQQGEAQSDVKLITPHFEAVVSLQSDQATRLRSGSRATVAIGALNESIGSRLWRYLVDWAR